MAGSLPTRVMRNAASPVAAALPVVAAPASAFTPIRPFSALSPQLRDAVEREHAHWHAMGPGIQRDVRQPTGFQLAAHSFGNAQAWWATMDRRAIVLSGMGGHIGGDSMVTLGQEVLFGGRHPNAFSGEMVRRAATEFVELIVLCAPHTRPLAEAMYRATQPLLQLYAGGHERRAESTLRHMCGLALRTAGVPLQLVQAWRLDEAITDAAQMVRARDRLRTAAESDAAPTPDLAEDALTVMHYYGAVGCMSGEVELMLWASPHMVDVWPKMLRYIDRLNADGHLPANDTASLRGTWKRARANIAQWASANAPRLSLQR